MDQSADQLAKRIRALRAKFGLSQRAFADITRLSQATISRMESGVAVATGLTVLALTYLERLDSPDELKKKRLISATALKRERKEMGLSKYGLAKYLDVSQTTVKFWESGKLNSANVVLITLAIEQLKIELSQRKELSEMTVKDSAKLLFEDLLAA